VQRLVPALVGGAAHQYLLAFDRDGELGVDQAADLPLGALHRDPLARQRGGDALGQRNGFLADTRHGASYQTTASSSPPTWAVRASRSVMTPCGVERMAMPRPFFTRGISRALT